MRRNTNNECKREHASLNLLSGKVFEKFKQVLTRSLFVHLSASFIDFRGLIKSVCGAYLTTHQTLRNERLAGQGEITKRDENASVHEGDYQRAINCLVCVPHTQRSLLILCVVGLAWANHSKV